MHHYVLFFQCEVCGRWTTGVIGVGEHAQFGASDNSPYCSRCSAVDISNPIPMALRAALPWS